VKFFLEYSRVLYREAESYVSHHKTSKHQCTRFGSVPKLISLIILIFLLVNSW